MTRSSPQVALLLGVAAMAAVVVTSNVLVQYPVNGTIGPFILPDILTWGAFSYPLAFLVTDVVNRTFGPSLARRVAIVGFVIAVIMSLWLANPRIALASGTAFLCAQLLDVQIFNRLRYHAWWRAPLASSIFGSALDTTLFFTLAFAAMIPFGIDAFAVETQPLFGLSGAIESPRWVSWAIADFVVKVLVAGVALGPYRALTTYR